MILYVQVKVRASHSNYCPRLFLTWFLLPTWFRVSFVPSPFFSGSIWLHSRAYRAIFSKRGSGLCCCQCSRGETQCLKRGMSPAILRGNPPLSLIFHVSLCFDHF